MRRDPGPRGAIWIMLAGCAGAPGCIHNHYYGTASVCPPIGQTVATQVCETPGGQVIVGESAPPGIGSNLVLQTPIRSSIAAPIVGPRIVTSQPAYGPPTGPGLSRFKWHRADPEGLEGLATTKVEGGLDDGPVRK